MGKRIIVVLVFLLSMVNITGCSSKGIKGLPSGMMIGESRNNLEDKYKDNKSDSSSDNYFIADGLKFGNTKARYTCYINKKNNTIKKIEVSDFGLGQKKKEVIKEFTSLYGKPIHKENYNDLRRDDHYYIWKASDDIYAILNVNFSSATFERISTKTLEKQKSIKKKRDKLLKEDKDLKTIYDAMVLRTSYENRNISAVIKDFSGRFDPYYTTTINGYPGKGGFTDTVEAGDYSVDFRYEYDNPHIYKYADKELGKIIRVSCFFGKTGKYSDVNKLMNALFGTPSKKESNSSYWQYSPYIDYINHLESDRVMLTNNTQYAVIDPKYNNSNSTKKIKRDEPSSEETLGINDNEISLSLDEMDDKFTAIGVAESGVRERLKVPSSASFCSSYYYTGGRSGNNVFLKGYVDAENSFGAKIRTNFIAELKVDKYGDYTFDTVIFNRY